MIADQVRGQGVAKDLLVGGKGFRGGHALFGGTDEETADTVEVAVPQCLKELSQGGLPINVNRADSGIGDGLTEDDRVLFPVRGDLLVGKSVGGNDQAVDESVFKFVETAAFLDGRVSSGQDGDFLIGGGGHGDGIHQALKVGVVEEGDHYPDPVTTIGAEDARNAIVVVVEVSHGRGDLFTKGLTDIAVLGNVLGNGRGDAPHSFGNIVDDGHILSSNPLDRKLVS